MPGRLNIKTLINEFDNRTESMENNLKIKFSSEERILFSKIQAVIDAWDPYRLGHFPIREYESEVWNIFQIIRMNGSVDDIEEYLNLEYKDHPLDMLDEIDKRIFLKECKLKAREIFDLAENILVIEKEPIV